LPGRRSLKQIVANVAAGGWSLSDEELAEVDRITGH